MRAAILTRAPRTLAALVATPLPLLLLWLVSSSLNVQQTPGVDCRPDLWKTLTGSLSGGGGGGEAGVQNNIDEARISPGPMCGYKSCPVTDPSKLNVHIIAHTHDDVGWLKTVDQYFFGTRKADSLAGVQYILDSVIPQLLMDKSKRFIYVEMSFFVKWWEEQEESMRQTVRQLVNEGRLEFINGGWCMNDEATVTYHSTIEQMTLGLKFLNETFGTCGHPKVGWQIDPFGHTNEQASLFAQFGFDGMFFTRIGYQEKIHRTLNKSLDLIWHGDRALAGQSGSIFTNVFRDGYDAPNGYCFDALCKDNVVVDNKKSYEYNVDSIGNYMIQFVREYASAKLTNHLLVPFGGDFQYSSAGQNFKSLDKLFKYMRANAPDINVFYSTPSCYQYSVHEALSGGSGKPDARSQPVLPEKYNDFMPYDSSRSVWWSGYFASRPSVKLVEREVANLLQVARLISLSRLLTDAPHKNWIETVEGHEAECLRPLWEILGDLQHHDAVTGTEKQHVADDYVRRSVDAMRLCARFVGAAKRLRLERALEKSTAQMEQLRKSGRKYHLDSVYLEDTVFCPLLNISQCDPLESEVDMRRYYSVGSSSNLGTRPSPAVSPISSRDSVSSVAPVATHGHKPEQLPVELMTKSVLITAYNPLAKPASNLDVRLPCNGRCDLDRVQVVHLGTDETLRLTRLPVPAGVAKLPFREAHTTYEILFYANVPALGSASFLLSDQNGDEIVDEELNPDDSILITDNTPPRAAQSFPRSRRVRTTPPAALEAERYEYFTMGTTGNDNDHDGDGDNWNIKPTLDVKTGDRSRREVSNVNDAPAARGLSEQVVVKFDMNSGVIVGLRRASDGSFLNITQKFGFYFPADDGHRPGAYIFRPNSTQPHLLQKPASFKMFKRQNGALIEIHQKWTDWIWQTIRVDAKKNYIEFDYVVGPIPDINGEGREVITRYMTNMANGGVFLTDSNARQLLPRHRFESDDPTQVGGSFFPVVSTIMLRNNDIGKLNKSAEAVAILVDRSQAGTSLNQGDMELLIHRRQMQDDGFGVGEPLNEPGEDLRGLVTRGRHRLFLKFQDQHAEFADMNKIRQSSNKPRSPILVKLDRTPRENLEFERVFNDLYRGEPINAPLGNTYLVHDQLLDDLRQESIKYALRPILTFDRLRVGANEFLQMLHSDDSKPHPKSDYSMLNTSLPNNIHLLTLQPWNRKTNQILIRLENLDNPLTIHPLPDIGNYNHLLRAYKSVGREFNQTKEDDGCLVERLTQTEFDIAYLLKNIRMTNLEELNLGANVRLSEDKRLDWTQEQVGTCNIGGDQSSPTKVKLGPRQIRTFLAEFESIPIL